MKTIEQYKEAAIYFPPGRIVPNWILRIVKGHKRSKRSFKFGAPTWVLPCGDRMVIFGASELSGACLIRVKDVKNIAADAAQGMENIFVLNGCEAVTAKMVYGAISMPLNSPAPIVSTEGRIKIKGTKLQRRRAKVAAKRERLLDKKIAQFRDAIAAQAAAKEGAKNVL